MPRYTPVLWNRTQILTSHSTCEFQCPVFVLQVDYLRSRQLGGAAVWTLDMDDFSGQFCEQGKYPLISHLKRKLSEGEATKLYITLFTPEVSPKLKDITDIMGDSGSIQHQTK